MFLYFCLNTIVNDIKKKTSIINTLIELALIVLGVYVMKTVI